MKAEGVDFHFDPAPAGAFHATLQNHVRGPAGDHPGIMEDCAGKLSGQQFALIGVAAVGKGLQGKADSLTPALLFQGGGARGGQGEEDGAGKGPVKRAGDFQEQVFLIDQMIVKGAVELHVLQGKAVKIEEPLQRTHLVDQVADQVLLGDVHEAPAEAGPVGEPRMGADPDAVIPAEADGSVHHGGVGGMESAGDVGGGDKGCDGRIVADFIGAVGFTHIAVEVDRKVHGSLARKRAHYRKIAKACQRHLEG